MTEFREINENEDEVDAANEVKLPQESAAPQQEVQEAEETTVEKGEIAAALKDETPAIQEVTAPQQEVQEAEETTVEKGEIAAALKDETPAIQETAASKQEAQEAEETTDDNSGGLKKSNVTGDMSPRQPRKTDYSTLLWGTAIEELNQENREINQFVQDLERQGLTPEQYLAQKRAEYAALDEPFPKEGKEAQKNTVKKGEIAAALKDETAAKQETVAPPQEAQEAQETTVEKGEIAAALQKKASANQEAAPTQQEVQAPQETTVAKTDIANTVKKELDETDSINLKFISTEDIKSFLQKSLEKFKSEERKNNQTFLEYLQKNNTTIEELIQQPIEKGRNYSRYVTNIANLAIDAGISPRSAGTIAHRVAELHTLNAHPELILNGSRLVEQEIGGGLEVDRVIVRKGIHHIKDFKPIHLSDFEQTKMGGEWVKYMSDRYSADFREKIKSGKLLPMTTKMDPSIKQALKEFMRDDVRQYKNKLETYRGLYKNERKLDDAKVKVSVQPYYVF